MRIDGLSHPPRVSQSNQRSDSVRPKKDSAAASDTVEISQDAQEVADLKAAFQAAPEELHPRLAEIRGRIESGFYDSREVLEDIANVLVDSDGLQEVVSDISTVRSALTRLAETPDVRPGVVEQARERVNSQFFDQPEIRQETMNRFLDELA